ncbi:hypothetical protein NEOC65_001536 [Neochlamydia sp. AcF65]|nr:hypothetical protein [Neochlamydia sp. AcF65]MBS4169317.1 hypothetical protein [Neochlamydia sp. AcF95]NGY95664.1 hypothetical protein [Neochlamydia sp. AcF84]
MLKYPLINLRERHTIILRCLAPPYQKFYYSKRWSRITVWERKEIINIFAYIFLKVL